VIAEGRILTPDDARRALEAGAWAVVVGKAITMPHTIVERFAKAIGGSTPDLQGVPPVTHDS
jgi:putative N-acetylmannosamine-6-phosphate epimerase